jgi:transcriptional regulator with XRE-family HTH domain
MGTEFNNYWETSNKKLPFEHTCVYTPESWELQSSSATQMQLLTEHAFLEHGSGSYWVEMLSGLPQHKTPVIPVNIGGVWSVLVVDAGVGIEKQLSSPASVGEKLTDIRDSFGLSAAALASILRASRASVYNWLENEIPTDNFVQRIEQLSTIVAQWQEMNPFHFPPGRLMKQKLGKGVPMLERLSREELDSVEIQTGMGDLLTLMTKHRERMDKAKRRASSNGPIDSADHREILERVTGSITADR